jgi:hypothetical protein
MQPVCEIKNSCGLKLYREKTLSWKEQMVVSELATALKLPI